jgi:prepilin-type N-terminal cleavage/methylation domain-containing protein
MHEAARPTPVRGEAGFTLIEVVVATVIAAIAVLGLAHTFGAGRALIDRYMVARDALAMGQQRLESLLVLSAAAPELTLGAHAASPITLASGIPATEQWTVDPVDDAADGKGGADLDGDTNDYQRITVTVSWGSRGFTDQIQLVRNRYVVP